MLFYSHTAFITSAFAAVADISFWATPVPILSPFGWHEAESPPVPGMGRRVKPKWISKFHPSPLDWAGLGMDKALAGSLRVRLWLTFQRKETLPLWIWTTEDPVLGARGRYFSFCGAQD